MGVGMVIFWCILLAAVTLLVIGLVHRTDRPTLKKLMIR